MVIKWENMCKFIEHYLSYNKKIVIIIFTFLKPQQKITTTYAKFQPCISTYYNVGTMGIRESIS